MTRFGDCFTDKREWLKELARKELSMPIADEPISRQKQMELAKEKIAMAHLEAMEEMAKENLLTSTSHPECRMTRMRAISDKLFDSVTTFETDHDDFEKLFHDAAHEYAMEAAWVNSDTDRVELKKWAYDQARYTIAASTGEVMKEAESILKWLLKP